jgi:hypothetical protein
VLDWFVFTLLGLAWSPILVTIHELGHGLAALAVTDGEVSIRLRTLGLAGGFATYDSSRLRRASSEALIAAAGPAASLVAAVVLWYAWLGTNDGSVILAAGAAGATFQFVATAIPVHYGAGLGGPAESDGRVIWRVLTGAPPGGIERELRRLQEPERAVRPLFAGLLVLIGVLALALNPVLAVALVITFGLAALMQRHG